MKRQVFTTTLLQYLPYFSSDQPGQLVTCLSDDDIKEFLFHAMTNSWKKKMVELGYTYLDSHNQSMAGIYETRIKNLEKSIPPAFSRIKKRKGSTKRKTTIFEDEDDEGLDKKP